MSSLRFHLRVNPSEIIYINGILDSYEGLGVIRTEDEARGLLTLYSDSSAKATVEAFINALHQEGLSVDIIKTDHEDRV